MKMVKSLLLGCAAGLVACTGAQAADLPVKAKPVQYVKIISLNDVGGSYMPDANTKVTFAGAQNLTGTYLGMNANDIAAMKISATLGQPATSARLEYAMKYTVDARAGLMAADDNKVDDAMTKMTAVGYGTLYPPSIGSTTLASLTNNTELPVRAADFTNPVNFIATG